MSGAYYLLPKDQQYTFVDQNLQPIGHSLSQWPDAWCAHPNYGLAYVTDAVYFRDCSGVMHHFAYPKESTAKYVCFLPGLLLIGGQGGTEKIFAYDLQTKQKLDVEHPKLLLKYRKSKHGMLNIDVEEECRQALRAPKIAPLLFGRFLELVDQHHAQKSSEL